MYELCLLKNKNKQCADISTQMYLPDKVFNLRVTLCVFERDVCPACSEDEKEINSVQTVFNVCVIMPFKVFCVGNFFLLQQASCTFSIHYEWIVHFKWKISGEILNGISTYYITCFVPSIRIG
jgi:hypothetical protein